MKSIDKTVVDIKIAAKSLAAKRHITKVQLIHLLYQSADTNRNLEPSVADLFINNPLGEHTLNHMPEEAFCKVVDVSDCKYKTQQCNCTMQMVFGETSSVCHRVHMQSGPSRCIATLPHLRQSCVVGVPVLCAGHNQPSSGPCAVLVEKNRELEDANKALHTKVSTLDCALKNLAIIISGGTPKHNCLDIGVE